MAFTADELAPLKMPFAEYRAMGKAIVAAAPEDQRDWLRGAVGSFNGPSLKPRTLAVVHPLPAPVRERLLPNGSRSADTLYRARNELCHSGSSQAGFATLVSLRQGTSAVLYLALLTELGIPDRLLEQAAERDPYLSFASTRSRREFGSAGHSD